MKVIGIIRSLNERTEEFAKYLLKQQLDDVYVIKNIEPLISVIIETLNIGITSGADFMITNDADVLILPNVVEKMINEIKFHKSLLITGRTYDKFLGIRYGGIRIYDCAKLQKPLSLLQCADETVLRPESHISKTFGGTKSPELLTSLHEYEQYYKDLYKRFAYQSIKTPKLAKIIKNFKNIADLDFRVAYKGFFDETKDFNNSFSTLQEKNKSNIPEFKIIYDNIIKTLP